MDYNHNNITGAPTIYLSIIYYSSHNLYSFYVIKSHIKMSLLEINFEKRCILDVDHLHTHKSSKGPALYFPPQYHFPHGFFTPRSRASSEAGVAATLSNTHAATVR